MSTIALKRSYQIEMPSSYVDVDRDEMEYVDGGWYICTVETAGNWIDAAIIGVCWAMGLGGAVSAIRAGGAQLAKRVGVRTARAMAQKAFRKACWFLSAGTAYAMADFVLTASGCSIGKLAAMFIDTIDAKRYSNSIEI